MSSPLLRSSPPPLSPSSRPRWALISPTYSAYSAVMHPPSHASLVGRHWCDGASSIAWPSGGHDPFLQLAAVRSGAGSRVLDLTLKVAAGVVLDVVGGVDDPAAGVVEPRGLEMRIKGVKKIRPRIEAVRVRPVRKRRIPAEITKVKKPKI
nr:hypothetical protein Iba_chr03bCG6380 [Ipomoea batatas]